MSSMDKVSKITEARDREFDKLVQEFRVLLIDGIKHGFFNAEISVTTPQYGRRQVLISAGKSYKYTIRIDDLPL